MMNDAHMLIVPRSDDAMSTVAKGVQAVTKKHGGANFEFSRSDKEAADLWQGRKAALWSVLALRENAKVWTTDVWCVYNACTGAGCLTFGTGRSPQVCQSRSCRG